MKSKIEWTDDTWNWSVGCQVVSPGCTHCYAMRMAAWMQSMNPRYAGVVRSTSGKPPVWSGKVAEVSDRVWNRPTDLKEPSLIFTMSMSDFFYEEIPDEWRDRALAIIRECPQHRFQVLTKRPDEAIRYMRDRGLKELPDNVWLGVSVEDRKRTERIETLRRIPCRVRFLSVEPLLGPLGKLDLRDIDWVITGGESGPGARSMPLTALTDAHERVLAAGVPLYFKQYGKAQNNPLAREAPPGVNLERWVVERERYLLDLPEHDSKGGAIFGGRTYREFPVHAESGWSRLDGLACRMPEISR